MKFIIKLVIHAIIIMLIAYLLKNDVVVTNFISALCLAFVLALLNTLVKPILVILTIPITIITLGLFLLVINAGIILLADYFVEGFSINGFLNALIFSTLLTISVWILERFDKEKSN
jgi:putative membrane protein